LALLPAGRREFVVCLVRSPLPLLRTRE